MVSSLFVARTQAGSAETGGTSARRDEERWKGVHGAGSRAEAIGAEERGASCDAQQ